MPYIHSKVTTKLSDIQKETLKTELGKIICTIPGKSENFLMVGLEDSFELYFRGNKLDLGAFIEVKIFGSAPKQALETMTGQICHLYEKTLGIPQDAIYVTYQSVSDWGWNGHNF